jgi:hypothetical protein
MKRIVSLSGGLLLVTACVAWLGPDSTAQAGWGIGDGRMGVGGGYGRSFFRSVGSRRWHGHYGGYHSGYARSACCGSRHTHAGWAGYGHGYRHGGGWGGHACGGGYARQVCCGQGTATHGGVGTDSSAPPPPAPPTESSPSDQRSASPDTDVPPPPEGASAAATGRGDAST